MSGARCRSPADGGRARCRMPGGAPGSGAPAGNQNALKQGHFTRAALAERKAMRATLKAMRQLLEKFEDT